MPIHYMSENEGIFAVFTSTEDWTVYGSSARDFVITGVGDDTIFGYGGNDSLGGGKGNDKLEGGKGDDTYTLFDVSPFYLNRELIGETYDRVYEDAGNGIDTVIVDPAPSFFGGFTTWYTLPANVENATVREAFEPFDLDGNGLDNRLTGGVEAMC